MTVSLKGMRLRVVGAGAFGLSTAVAAARLGARVSVFSADPVHVSASAVAAGMLSPVFEALEGGPEHFPLLHKALTLWEDAGRAPVERTGALYVGGDLVEMAGALETLGADFDRLSAAQARRLQPGLPPGAEALFTPVEARISPAAALGALIADLRAEGGELIVRAAPSDASFEAWRMEADAVVIAAGYASRRWSAHGPALGLLTPIKGHILHFDGEPTTGPTVRSREGYIAPQPNGAVFGATMQTGCADLTVEPEIADGLFSRAIALAPELAARPYLTRVGVRAATPDGLPFAGRLGSGLFAATGARRNGWLLAPLVAEAVVAALAGEAEAPRLDPARFG
jgi:glycine oxidase